MSLMKVVVGIKAPKHLRVYSSERRVRPGGEEPNRVRGRGPNAGFGAQCWVRGRGLGFINLGWRVEGSKER
jgi:hypothetical protein